MRTTTTINTEIEREEISNYDETIIRFRCDNSPLHICLQKYLTLKSESVKGDI